jgi:translation initiation factor 1
VSARRREGDRLVWSSERGDLRGGAPGRRDARTGGGNRARVPDDGVARVRRETAGRHGKTVTAIHGLALGEAALRELASELKRLCGSGGSAKDGGIEIQGDHVDKVLEALRARGLPAKRAGG